MGSFKKKVWVEYPIPSSVSIWGDIDNSEESDLDVLIDTCVCDLQSDICITAVMRATANSNKMPDGCRDIVSVRLDQQFQGNTTVKKTYDSVNNILYLRYFPCIVKYRRNVLVADLDTLVGDMMIYVRAYVLWKMATKELVQITSVTLNADNGEVNTEVLKAFRDECKSKYEALKPEITLYVNGS
jgi:hypothetical protein